MLWGKKTEYHTHICSVLKVSMISCVRAVCKGSCFFILKKPLVKVHVCVCVSISLEDSEEHTPSF